MVQFNKLSWDSICLIYKLYTLMVNQTNEFVYWKAIFTFIAIRAISNRYIIYFKCFSEIFK